MQIDPFSRENIEACFDYRPEEGAFYWKVTPRRKLASVFLGQRAGTYPPPNRQENPQIKIKGQRKRVSAMVWFMETGEWPTAYLYHKDGDKNNNCFSNLTYTNPGWGKGKTLKASDIALTLMNKNGQWYVREGETLHGPYDNMGLAANSLKELACGRLS